MLVNKENAIFCFIILHNMCPVRLQKCTLLALPITPFSSVMGIDLATYEAERELAMKLGLQETNDCHPPPPRAAKPSAPPLPAPGARNQSQAPAGFSGWRLEVVPRAPLKGVGVHAPEVPNLGTLWSSDGGIRG